ncbi:hypothetical protein GPECTOR_95g685 [Gonium pectorale]|uniref:Rubisco LSMT substrate-binding domain-containing protein n=1 Tax=Gonium pectorale TaxID=33097 RepID=A0A150G093_GONPE|nr:hypothetical protein GPECTOR_95g685 [Gonium pectorale]|eukprot:KXZ43296.1 hypothetical protein GPECTOR_95g685 [Gonium pectorale]
MSALRARSSLLRGSPNASFRDRVRAVGRRASHVVPRSATVHTASELVDWLKENGARIDAVEVRTVEVPSAGRPLDVVVAARPLAPGEVAFSVPEHLVLTLDRIFESEFVAELLTTDKLSELACLALYLMYEKKLGKKSFWYPYIKELDRQRARGPQAVESPLLWSNEELTGLLQGSPLLPAVRGRLAGIRKEYEALDTVWFMAGSLFNKYPFDLPTETFSFELFKQAFSVVQASLVHLQGVPIAKRFALVPMGPPLLAYSSTSKAMVTFNQDNRAVELVMAGPAGAGAPLAAWCGPQPNNRLLLNYGVVDEHNPFDKLQVAAVSFAEDAPPLEPRAEEAALAALMGYVRRRQAAYPHPLWRDLEIIADPASSPRAKVAARLTKIEKSILAAAVEALAARGAPTDPDVIAAAEARAELSGLQMGSFFDGQGHCG